MHGIAMIFVSPSNRIASPLMLSRKLLMCTAVFLIQISATGVIASPAYRVKYLGITFNNGISAKFNNNAEIVGVSGFDLSGQYYKAGSFSNYEVGTRRSLNSIVSQPGNFQASAISDSGYLAGSFSVDFGPSQAYAFIEGELIDLGVLPGYRTSVSTDINDKGEAVGFSRSTGGTSYAAFVYRNGKVEEIGSGQASAISNDGIVVGTTSANRAFKYEGGTLSDLGDFGDGPRTSAVDINDAGQILGTSYVRNQNNKYYSHPFIYEDGVWRDLGLPEDVPLGIPIAINNLGEVVGNSNGSLGADDRPPFLYTEGSIYNLQKLLDSSAKGFSVRLVYDINDSGTILAQGWNGSGYQAVLLLPIPEPSAVFLLTVAPAYSFVLYRPRRGHSNFR